VLAEAARSVTASLARFLLRGMLVYCGSGAYKG